MTRISTVSSTVCSGAHQRKYQNSASLALVRGTPLTKMDSPHKRPVARKMFGIDDVFMRHITARPRTSDMGCSMYDLCSISVILCYSVSWLGRVITKLDCIINISLKIIVQLCSISHGLLVDIRVCIRTQKLLRNMMESIVMSRLMLFLLGHV